MIVCSHVGRSVAVCHIIELRTEEWVSGGVSIAASMEIQGAQRFLKFQDMTLTLSNNTHQQVKHKV